MTTITYNLSYDPTEDDITAYNADQAQLDATQKTKTGRQQGDRKNGTRS